MKPFVVEIKTDSTVGGSLVTGRNGVHQLAAIRMNRIPSGHVFIDGIGKSGKILNAGFYLIPNDADNFLRGFKDAGIII